jgi:hypothetical protein
MCVCVLSLCSVLCLRLCAALGQATQARVALSRLRDLLTAKELPPTIQASPDTCGEANGEGRWGEAEVEATVRTELRTQGTAPKLHIFIGCFESRKFDKFGYNEDPEGSQPTQHKLRDTESTSLHCNTLRHQSFSRSAEHLQIPK